jgi:hypothetical protein
MAQPTDPPPAPPPAGTASTASVRALGARPAWMLPSVTFAGGVLVGVLVMGLVRGPTPHPAPPPAPVAQADPAPPTAQPAPTPTPPPATAPAAPTEVELAITTRPPGATLTVDGKPAGESPQTLKLAPGKHEVTAAKDRYASETQTAAAPGSLRITLDRPSAKLRVASTPPGALITVAGVARGKTPAEVKLPAFESYEVRLEAPGNQPWRKSIYVRPPATSVEAKLAPEAKKKK